MQSSGCYAVLVSLLTRVFVVISKMLSLFFRSILEFSDFGREGTEDPKCRIGLVRFPSGRRSQ